MTEAPFPIPPSVEDKPRVFPVPGWRELMYCSLLAWLPWMWTVLVPALLIVVADADWMITLPTFVGVYVLLYVLVVLLTAGMAKLLLRLNHHSPLMAHVLLTCGVLAVLSLIFCRDALFGRVGVLLSLFPLSLLLYGLLRLRAADTQLSPLGEAGRHLLMFLPYIGLSFGLTLDAEAYSHGKWISAGIVLAKALLCSLAAAGILTCLSRRSGLCHAGVRILHIVGAVLLPVGVCWVLWEISLRELAGLIPVFLPIPVLLMASSRRG